MHKKSTHFNKRDVIQKDRMVDIIFEDEVPVRAQVPISIMVRFSVEDNFMAMTQLGYGGENYRGIRENEKDAFKIHDSPDCTKGETDSRFGNIPRIFYF
jgi:hypothetical protein